MADHPSKTGHKTGHKKKKNSVASNKSNTAKRKRGPKGAKFT